MCGIVGYLRTGRQAAPVGGTLLKMLTALGSCGPDSAGVALFHDPVGITTQDPELTKRLPVDGAADRVENFLHALTTEIQILARACGKSDVRNLDPNDLRALTSEASMITGVPLAGANKVWGGGPGWSSAPGR